MRTNIPKAATPPIRHVVRTRLKAPRAALQAAIPRARGWHADSDVRLPPTVSWRHGGFDARSKGGALILAVALTVVVCPRTAFAQAPTNQELLERIAVLEAEAAELKRLVTARAGSENSADGAATTADASVTRDSLRGAKYGASLDTYYGYNFNRPVGRVNLLRAYDVTSNNFALSQASVVLESDPDIAAGRRFGARVDLQYGQATETLQGSLANEPRPWVYRNVFQAYGTYVFPVGSGLTVDFGKWASSIGLEGNYSKDQANY